MIWPLERLASFSDLVCFVLRSTAVHVVTYVTIGALSYWFIARPYWAGGEALAFLRNPEELFVQHWLIPAQILRGALFGIAFLPIRACLVAKGKWGGLVVAFLLLLLGAFAGISGSIEVWLYTRTFHSGLFLVHLPEIVLQALLYGYLLLAWESRVQNLRAIIEQSPGSSR